jgi:aspartate kinase
MSTERNTDHTAKYGGHTCTDYSKLIELVLLKKPKFIIVSAPGKTKNYKKVTGLLIDFHSALVKNQDTNDIWVKIVASYKDSLAGISCELDFDSLFEGVEKSIYESRDRDFILSRGEYMSSIIAAAVSNAHGYPARFIDAAELFFFGEDGSLDYNKTISAIKEKCTGDEAIFIPGFYGTDSNGNIKVFPRGGSDISGVLVADAMKTSYVKWTNTGVCTADPGKVSAAQHIPDITHKEIRLLAYSGADVLQKDVIPYLLRGKIEMTVCNMYEPNNPGTKIIPNREVGDKSIKAVSGKTNFTIIMIEKAFLSTEYGSTMEILAVLKEAKIPYDQDVPCVDSWFLTVDNEYLPDSEEATQELLNKLRSVSDSVSVVENLSVLFGICPTDDCNHIKQSSWSLLYKKEISIFADSMIFSGGTDNTAQIMYVVHNSDFKEAYDTMHSAFLWRRA